VAFIAIPSWVGGQTPSGPGWRTAHPLCIAKTCLGPQPGENPLFGLVVLVCPLLADGGWERKGAHQRHDDETDVEKDGRLGRLQEVGHHLMSRRALLASEQHCADDGDSDRRTNALGRDQGASSRPGFALRDGAEGEILIGGYDQSIAEPGHREGAQKEPATWARYAEVKGQDDANLPDQHPRAPDHDGAPPEEGRDTVAPGGGQETAEREGDDQEPGRKGASAQPLLPED
jgi:hypothetical protein